MILIYLILTNSHPYKRTGKTLSILLTSFSLLWRQQWRIQLYAGPCSHFDHLYWTLRTQAIFECLFFFKVGGVNLSNQRLCWFWGGFEFGHLIYWNIIIALDYFVFFRSEGTFFRAQVYFAKVILVVDYLISWLSIYFHEIHDSLQRSIIHYSIVELFLPFFNLYQRCFMLIKAIPISFLELLFFNPQWIDFFISTSQ